MAASSSPPFFIFLAVLASFFLTHTFSRTLPKPVTHTSLDVSASLDQALHFLNTPTTEHEAEAEASLIFQSINASSAISLDLLSRESILKSNHHTDYKSLVLSRLRRDSARVNSLSAKLLLSRSDDEFLPQSSSELSTPITSGSNQGSGEYFSRIGVGTPPKPFYMVLDTGSDVKDPIFNPSASSTYSPVSCDSPLCSSLELSSCRSTPQQCLYQVNYGDGSFTTGDFVTESVSFGSSASRIALGCGHDNEGLFVGAAGLLGLGGGPLSLTSQLKATSFSYCLVNRDSPASSSRDAFVRLTPNLRRTSGVALFDTCYDMSGMKSVKVPTVAFHFSGGGRAWNLPAANYLIPVDSDGTFCFAFAPTSSSLSIIGNVQQQGTRVSFDLANKRVGFSTNKC
ncbi:Protein ASPARTIC PROTEASE IN GUARD CELL 1 [Linum perenne]